MCCQGAPDVGGFVRGDSAALTVSQSRQHATWARFRGYDRRHRPPRRAPDRRGGALVL